MKILLKVSRKSLRPSQLNVSFPIALNSKGWVGRSDKKNQKIISKYYNSFKLKTFLFSLRFPKIWVGYVFFKWYFEKKWVGRAMGNETIYWDGLICFTVVYKTK